MDDPRWISLFISLGAMVMTLVVGYVTFKVSQKGINEANDLKIINLEKEFRKDIKAYDDLLKVKLAALEKDILKNDERMDKRMIRAMHDIEMLTAHQSETNARLANIETGLHHVSSAVDDLGTTISSLMKKILQMSPRGNSSTT